VIKKGANVESYKVGDILACAGSAHHAEIIVVSEKLTVKVPNEVSLEDACFTTLGAITIQGLRRAECQFGETVVIIGTGLLGLLATQIAKVAGLQVIAVDINKLRLNKAKKLGADHVFNFYDDVVDKIYAVTKGYGADAAIIYAASSSDEIINIAMDMVRIRGKIVIVGDIGLNLQREKMYKKELEILMSTSYGPGRYDPTYEEKGQDYPIGYVRWTENRNMQSFIEMLQQKKIKTDLLLQKTGKITDINETYEYLSKPEVISVAIEYDPKKFQKESHTITSPKISLHLATTRKDSDKIGVGIIGVGSFTKNTILPLISKISNYQIKGLASKHGFNVSHLAKRYSADYFTSDYKKILEDNEVDLVIIATRHNLHSSMVIDSLNANKITFVEKPLCINEKELQSIISCMKKQKIPLIVGYNRRYSPCINEIRDEIIASQKISPILMDYRVNAPFIPKDNWIQDRNIGGGRIIGEACHFLDLINHLIDAEDTTSINISAMDVDNKRVVSNDNLVVSMKWSNGSVSTLTYTTLGSSNYPKEEIKILTGKKVISITDFKLTEIYDTKGRTVRYNNKQPDKGHYNQFKELAKLVKGEENHILSFNELLSATKMSFTIDKITRGQ
ncbi:MAG: zinc-binding dehydrogenase, partial [Asgard group archaeon]|nr:zinc-binding dehydrogenase [Asgard group archaeon]